MKEGTAYYGDCFDIISNWENEGFKEVADLIYGDPPFNSNRNYGAPASKAQETDTGSMDAFVDMWTYDDKAIARTKRICKSVSHPASKIIQTLKDWLEEEDSGMLAYLSYMADRLWKLHGMLKQTGSIYLHCDPTANYYLRLLMDAVFGKENFRNEIVWHYRTGGVSKKWFARKHDTILFYSKTPPTDKTVQMIFNPAAVKIPRTEKSIKRAQNPKGARISATDLEKHPEDVFDIPALNPMASEREGYPTQKPLALLDRIILASSNPGTWS